MSLVKDAIKTLAEKGRLVHEFEIEGIKFVMEPLTLEEQILSDGFVDIDSLKKKYKTENRLSTYPDMVAKYRSLGQITFSIKLVNGQPPVDKTVSTEEQFQQIIAFRDELSELSPAIIDTMIKEYNKLLKKEQDFFTKFEENAGKS